MSAPRAFGGAGLDGRRPVLFAYLDESGIGDIKIEPYWVVAGLIIDPDRDWLAARNELDRIRYEYLGEDCEGVILHAMDIFQGNGAFSRERFSLQQRIGILRDIFAICESCDISVVYGYADRRRIQENPAAMHPHEQCYLHCLLWIEHTIRSVGKDGEVVTLVLENNDELQKRIKGLHKNIESGMEIAPLPSVTGNCYPPQRIMDVPHHCEKQGAPLLQIVDTVAFCIRRIVSRAAYWEELTVLPRSAEIHILADHPGSTVISGVL